MCAQARIPEPEAGGSKDGTAALFSFVGVKGDPQIRCVDFFQGTADTHKDL